MGPSKTLDEIRIATPCSTSWDEMPGDDQVRFCGLCSRSVYNIQAMTSDEAAALIEGREGRLCLRVFRRSDGTVVTADCPAIEDIEVAGFRPRFRFRRVHALALVLVALALCAMGRDSGRPRPTGEGITLDDWAQWAAVSLGIRPAPTSAPAYSPGITVGDCY